MNGIFAWVGERLAAYLSQPLAGGAVAPALPPERVALLLRPADVVLVEGHTRISVAVKYLSQSTWSHAALYVGDALGHPPAGEAPCVLIEAALREGVRAVPWAHFSGLNLRICRPVGLTAEDRARVIAYAVARLGRQYDLSHLVDLARYLLPTPPVPSRLRRRMLALGSGDPTRAICSTLIAEAFHSIRYPILPEMAPDAGDPASATHYRETTRVRTYGLYTPRDFDLSPFFGVVKPALAWHFDFHRLEWDDDLPTGGDGAGDGGPSAR